MDRPKVTYQYDEILQYYLIVYSALLYTFNDVLILREIGENGTLHQSTVLCYHICKSIFVGVKGRDM